MYINMPGGKSKGKNKNVSTYQKYITVYTAFLKCIVLDNIAQNGKYVQYDVGILFNR